MSTNLKAPMAEVRLYDRGAEGYCLDQGFTLYDIVAQSFAQARVTTETPTWMSSQFDVPTIVHLPEFGLATLNPLVRWRDQVLTDWTLSSSTLWRSMTVPWSARTAGTADVLMFAGAGGQSGWAETNFELPADPDFHVYFARMVPSRDATEEAYFRVRFGGSYEWVLSWEDEEGLALGHWDGDRYRRVLDLSPRSIAGGPRPYYPGLEYAPLKVVTRAGKLGVEVDPPEGVSALVEPHYSVFDPPGDVAVQQGPLRIEASGMVAMCGLCPIEPPDTGRFFSAPSPMFEERAGSPDVECVEDYHYYAPGPERPDERNKFGVTIPAGTGADEIAYRCTLRRVGVDMPGAPYQFFRAPSVLAVRLEYPTVVSVGTQNYANLTDTDDVDAIDVVLPPALDGGTGTIHIMLDPYVAFAGEYRRRYIVVRLGWLYSDDSYTLWDTCVGYISMARLGQMPSGREGICIALDFIDGSWPAQAATIDESWGPLDGMTVNAALTYAAAQVGIPATRLDLASNSVALARGPADNPIWWRTGELPVGMVVWDAMQRIAATAAMNLFVAPNGDWRTVAFDYQTATTHAFDMTAHGVGAADSTLNILESEHTAALLETGTGVIVSGQDDDGRQVAAWMLDFDEERDPATTLFTGHRIWERRTGRRYRDVAGAMREASALFVEQQYDHYDASLSERGRPQVFRRDLGRVLNGTASGFNPATDHLVLGVNHEWRALVKDTKTTVAMNRV